MIDFFLQSHRLILYLKRQQKVHPAKRFEIFRFRQHGLVLSEHFKITLLCFFVSSVWRSLCLYKIENLETFFFLRMFNNVFSCHRCEQSTKIAISYSISPNVCLFSQNIHDNIQRSEKLPHQRTKLESIFGIYSGVFSPFYPFFRTNVDR